jgi:hypothetical protein
MSFVRNSLLAIVAFAAICAAAPALADMVKYKAELTAAGEVPPTTSKGAGSIEATYDSATKTLSWAGAIPISLAPRSLRIFVVRLHSEPTPR